MKRFSKIIINALAVVILAVSCFGLIGCKKDIKTVELTLSLYDYENDTVFDEGDVAITIDFYRHLAPNTVDKMIDYVKEGYYDGAIFYQMLSKTGSVLSTVMVGDLKLDGEQIVLNDIKPMLDGEFDAGGTKGSNLVNEKGSIGLWRTWNARDDESVAFANSTSTDTGRATWFMPTTTLDTYDKYFCVLGKLDLDDTNTNDGLNGIISAFEDGGYFEEYVIYYTGEYDETKPNENFGLQFHCVSKEDFDEDVDGLFVAEEDQYVCYNHYTIRVPKTGENGQFTAVIKSAKVK